MTTYANYLGWRVNWRRGGEDYSWPGQATTKDISKQEVEQRAEELRRNAGRDYPPPVDVEVIFYKSAG
jgi:hypothetical protein